MDAHAVHQITSRIVAAKEFCLITGGEPQLNRIADIILIMPYPKYIPP